MLKSNFKNVNVPLPMSMYDAFLAFKMGKGIRTHLSFFAYAITHKRPSEGTYLRPLTIDGKNGGEASLLMQVGECVHRWDGKKWIAYDYDETMQVLNRFQEAS